MYKLINLPDSLPCTVRDTIDTRAPRSVLTPDIPESIAQWYGKYNNIIYRNSLFFKGPLLYTIPDIEPVSSSLATIPTIKSRTCNIILNNQNSGDPESWANSYFFIENIQGIRKSSRIAEGHVVPDSQYI